MMAKHTPTQLMQSPRPLVNIRTLSVFLQPYINGQCYIERLVAPSENVSVKLNTVYANVVFNKKHLHKASRSMLIRALK